MTQKQCVAAYRALSELNDKEWPLSVAYGLMKLKKALSDAWEFQIEQEKRLIEKHQGEILPRGQVRFPSSEAREAFDEAMAALYGMKVDVPCELVNMTGCDVRVSPDALAALEGFVIMEQEE